MAALVLLPLAGPAHAGEIEFLRCRTVAEALQRLACYDSVPAPASPAASAVLPRQAPEQFGLEQRATQVSLEVIESSIQGRFQGWRANDRIQLANGQVWQIADDSQGYVYAQDPKVTVRRGALGTFYLEFEGTNRSPRVKRVQ